MSKFSQTFRNTGHAFIPDKLNKSLDDLTIDQDEQDQQLFSREEFKKELIKSLKPANQDFVIRKSTHDKQNKNYHNTNKASEDTRQSQQDKENKNNHNINKDSEDTRQSYHYKDNKNNHNINKASENYFLPIETDKKQNFPDNQSRDNYKSPNHSSQKLNTRNSKKRVLSQSPLTEIQLHFTNNKDPIVSNLNKKFQKEESQSQLNHYVIQLEKQLEEEIIKNFNLTQTIQKKDVQLNQMRGFQNELCKTIEETQEQYNILREQFLHLQQEHQGLKSEYDQKIQFHEQQLKDRNGKMIQAEIKKIKFDLDAISQDNDKLESEKQQLIEFNQEKDQQIITLKNLLNKQMQEQQLQVTNQNEINEKVNALKFKYKSQINYLKNKLNEEKSGQSDKNYVHNLKLSNDNQKEQKIRSNSQTSKQEIQRNPSKELLNEQADKIFLNKLMKDFEVSNLQALSQVIQNMQQYQKNTNNFIECVTRTIIKLMPKNYFSEPPKLKLIWKILKQIMEEYAKNKPVLEDLEQMQRIIQKTKNILKLDWVKTYNDMEEALNIN